MWTDCRHGEIIDWDAGGTLGFTAARMLDLLITNGLIGGGAGNAGFCDDFALTGDEVDFLRGVASHLQAARTIDATGKVVCPGLIGMHGYPGLVILADT